MWHLLIDYLQDPQCNRSHSPPRSCCLSHVLPPTGSDLINANLDATTLVERQARQKVINTLKRQQDMEEQLHWKNTKEKMT